MDMRGLRFKLGGFVLKICDAALREANVGFGILVQSWLRLCAAGFAVGLHNYCESQ